MTTQNRQTGPLRPLTGQELNRIADRVAARLGQQMEDLMLSVFDEWLTAEELAAYLHLSKGYVTRNASIFGGIKFEKRWYFSRKNINDLLKGNPEQMTIKERELAMKLRKEPAPASTADMRGRLNELRSSGARSQTAGAM